MTESEPDTIEEVYIALLAHRHAMPGGTTTVWLCHEAEIAGYPGSARWSLVTDQRELFGRYKRGAVDKGDSNLWLRHRAHELVRAVSFTRAEIQEIAARSGTVFECDEMHGVRAKHPLARSVSGGLALACTQAGIAASVTPEDSESADPREWVYLDGAAWDVAP